MKKINFKSKKLWIIIVLVILGAWFISSLFQNKTVSNFETVTAERGNLIQTVDVTGTVDSANNLSLNFETMGTVSNIKVEVGDEVSQGDWLTNLSLTELNASVTQAQSSLNQKIAGATQEQINVSEKQINSARVALTQAESSLEDIINISENTIGSKYVYALNILEDTYIKMYNAYAVVESIKSEYFTNNDQNGLTVRSNQEYQIKVPRDEIKSLIDIAKESKSQEDIDNAISETIPALSKILNGLTVIRNICDDVSYQSVISSTEKGLLDSQKTAISGAQISASSLENEISLLK
ncbi:MAG: biotin/lipoyl-binding protein, partial [Candidatus Paceibacterota bacterium]